MKKIERRVVKRSWRSKGTYKVEDSSEEAIYLDGPAIIQGYRVRGSGENSRRIWKKSQSQAHLVTHQTSPSDQISLFREALARMASDGLTLGAVVETKSERYYVLVETVEDILWLEASENFRLSLGFYSSEGINLKQAQTLKQLGALYHTFEIQLYQTWDLKGLCAAIYPRSTERPGQKTVTAAQLRRILHCG